MGRKKKPFIDKKSAHKFGLVHRSQKDPLQADDSVSQRVLLPVAQANSKPDNAVSPQTDDEKQRDEQKLCGIYFEDDYNYLQHLKPRGENELVEVLPSTSRQKVPEKKQFGNVALPAGLFASETEEKEGMLLRGVADSGFNPNLDPDIVEALEGEMDLDDPDNILEDDFMMLADADGIKMAVEDGDSGSEGSDFGSDYSDDDSFGEELNFDKKSRFTEYSMTSSVMRRSNGLQLLDEQFENLMVDYDEDKIGGLDEDVNDGACDVQDDLIDAAITSFEKDMEVRKLDVDCDVACRHVKNTEGEDNDLFDEYDLKPDAPKEVWDCESVISTYSNLYNHPKVISDGKPSRKPIDLLGKEGFPVGVLRKKAEKEDMKPDEVVLVKKVNIVRSRNETTDDKKERKQQVKDERRARRTEKKERQLAFKSEKLKQEKAAIGKVNKIGLA